MVRGLVYLSGPITGHTYKDCTDWRVEAFYELHKYEIKALSPMRCKEFLANQGTIEDYKAYEGLSPLARPNGITTRDRWDTSRCDVILMNLLEAKRISIGTMIELGWADAYRKPVILVMEDHNIHCHPMLEHLAAYVVETLDEGIALCKALLL